MKYLVGAHLGAVAAMTLLVVGTVAHSATLTNASGPVLVNAGNGFKPATNLQNLPVGSQVMAQPGGQATVSYGLCEIEVGPGKVHSVRETAPCSVKGEILHDLFGTNGATAGAGGLGVAEVAVGIGIAAGAGAAIYFLSRPSSP